MGRKFWEDLTTKELHLEWYIRICTILSITKTYSWEITWIKSRHFLLNSQYFYQFFVSIHIDFFYFQKFLWKARIFRPVCVHMEKLPWMSQFLFIKVLDTQRESRNGNIMWLRWPLWTSAYSPSEPVHREL